MEVNTTDDEYDYFDDADDGCGDNAHGQQVQLPPVHPKTTKMPNGCFMLPNLSITFADGNSNVFR